MRKIRKFKKRFRFRKRRFKKKGRTFKSRVKKIINSTAETKVRTVFADMSIYPWDSNAAAPGMNLLDVNIPVLGTSKEDRIGNKYFIKSITIELAHAAEADAAAHIWGHSTIFTLKEKRKNNHRPVNQWIIQGMNGSPNSFEPATLQTTYKSVKRRDLYNGPPVNQDVGNILNASNERRHSLLYKKTFKINKTITLGADGFTTIPNIFVVPVSWAANYTTRFGEPLYKMKHCLRFTDV